MRLSDLAVAAFVILAVGALLGTACRKPSAAPRPAPVNETVSEPDSVLTAIKCRTMAKRQLACRVIAERIPLLEAAELFRQVNGGDGMDCLQLTALGRSTREKLCIQVIAYVAVAEAEMESNGQALSDPPVSARLQGELDRRLAAGEFAPESK